MAKKTSRGRILSTTMSVDDYFDELNSHIHDDDETVDLETARALIHSAIREEYARP